MNSHLSTLISGVAILLLSSCQQPAPPAKQDSLFADNLLIEWELVSNQVTDVPRCRTLFLIKNRSSQVLDDHGWAIFYNQSAGDVIPESVTGSVSIENLGGDFIRLSPGEGFRLSPGEEISIRADHGGWLIKEDRAPAGLYMVFYNENGVERSRYPLTNFVIRPFTRPEQRIRFIHDQVPDPTPEWQYEQNEDLSRLDGSLLPLVIPSPSSASHTESFSAIGRSTEIHFEKRLEPEAIRLANRLEEFLDVSVPSFEDDNAGKDIIYLGLAGQGAAPESYCLEITEKSGIKILGGDAAGVFYAVQSLLAMVPLRHYRKVSEHISIPVCTIEDAPRFPYRGMHLDVSRNFNKKEAVFKLIDAMSFYKLNTLHLHLTDDEGWRLQIPSLPELTDIGAFRGHTLDDHACLRPSYGSGPEPDSTSGYGSGFYTREDFIRILEYAHTRHVQVIPEFDFPGHARAAIMAMNARYRHFMKEGAAEKAEEFLLSDPEDRSEYRSAQNYNDNVICVCREATYRFIETIVDEVQAMYHEADVPLTTIHIGGDEVPKGAWEESPICSGFTDEHGINGGASGLMGYFLERTSKILKERDLILSGWEEIVLDRDETGGLAVKPPHESNGYQVYIWDNFTPGNQDIGNKIANAGYPVVLCSVTNYYFELAYNKDPREPGDYWGGFVDTRKAFEYVPFDVFKSLHTNTMGRPYDPGVDFQDMVRLNPGARDNILGIQGDLWSEPIKGPKMLEYFYLPKLLGLAERAWSRQPRWSTTKDSELYNATLQEDWNVFANILGQREMPRMDYLFGGYNYRLPPPGLKKVDGVLYANSQFPGLAIRYTTDGSAPTMDSKEYVAPVRVNGVVTACTFNSLGRASRTSVLPED